MKITCFGEVLWDIFPEHKKIGGAPLNVALRLHSMGVDTCLITRVGNDNLGNDIIRYIEEQEFSGHTFQIDPENKTGEVLVELDYENTATYHISYPVAWDFIAYSKIIEERVKESDAIIFGSLACRNKVSRNTLFRLLDKAKFKILDVNLRPPHYTEKILSKVMIKADFIKLNDEELVEICKTFKIAASTLEEQITAIAKHTNTNKVCITKGSKGATLYYKEVFYHNRGYRVKVVDTVGAGDSFLARLISGLLQNEKPQEALDYACAIGAMVAGSHGANPTFSKEEIRNFLIYQAYK